MTKQYSPPHIKAIASANEQASGFTGVNNWQ